MADEQRLHLPQALQAGAPVPTPSHVEMDEVKSILSGLDAESVQDTGDRYLKTAARLIKHADNLVAHAEALADIWRGPNADLSLQTLKQLHTAVTGISANASKAGETYQWLGTTILPFYQDSGRTMTDGRIHTDGDDENARKILDRLNARIAEANNGLPSQLTVVFPEVKALGLPDDAATPGPGGWAPQPYAPSGPGGQSPNGLGTPEIPTGPSGQTPEVPGNPGGPGSPGGQTPQTPGGPGGAIGNNTDLAGAQPPVGTGPGPLTPTGPTVPTVPGGPPVAPGGPGPFTVPAGPGPLISPTSPGGPRPPVMTGPGGLGTGPNGLASRARPVGVPRTGPGQGVPGVIGADRGMRASARGGMMTGGSRGGTADGGEEHFRSTWLAEDEDVWGTDSDVPPSVIG